MSEPVWQLRLNSLQITGLLKCIEVARNTPNALLYWEEIASLLDVRQELESLEGGRTRAADCCTVEPRR